MVVPEQNGLVNLAVESDRDLLIALAHGRRLEFGDALFEIGAAIAAKVSSLDGLVCERACECRGSGGHKNAMVQPQSPKHIAIPFGEMTVPSNITEQL